MKQKKKKIRMAALITVLSVLVLFFAVFLLFQTRKYRGDRKPVLSGRRTGKMGSKRQVCIQLHLYLVEV